MPENICYVPKEELLSYEEMFRVVLLLSKKGISKVRFTGGEPFLRKDIKYFIKKINGIEGIEQIHITTNGTLLSTYYSELHELGIKSLNLSLDSLDKQRFFEITRRDAFDQVMESFHQLIAIKMPLKINMVVMKGRNDQDILPMVELSKTHPVAVRFIEEMPFNGNDERGKISRLDFKEILAIIKEKHSNIIKLEDGPGSTALNYKIPGFKGSFGIIPAFSRTFCGTCNRIRITAQGLLKTCLYDEGVLDLKAVLRGGISDKGLEELLLKTFLNRPKNGFEAEAKRETPKTSFESMSTIGG